MATSLQAQLARIRASSTNALDLKAQRKAHAQSLLYEPKVAGSQDFDTLYQICAAGFAQLCSIDSRFSRYANTLFSEHSKDQDRTQLTKAQNGELDIVLDGFLTLVGGYILLAPATKAIEWLVRRFKIHEYNTQSLLLTFLPYHDHPAFVTVLSITPSSAIPQPLRFLAPFRESKQNPQRQSAVVAAIQNHSFLSALNHFVLSSCRKNHQYTRLVEFWTAVITEAVAGQLDAAASGRMELRIQKEEDVLLRVLPTLQEGLALKSSEVHSVCFMIMMILSTRLQLPDRTTEALMEAVAGLKPSEDGLLCLSTLAQTWTKAELPKKVIRYLLKTKEQQQSLIDVSARYRVDPLILMILRTVLRRLSRPGSDQEIDTLGFLLSGAVLEPATLKESVFHLMEAADQWNPSDGQSVGVQSRLARLVLQLASSKTAGAVVRDMIGNETAAETALVDTIGEAESDPMETLDSAASSEESFVNQLRALPDYSKLSTFLGNQTTHSLTPLLHVCLRAGTSQTRWSQILESSSMPHDRTTSCLAPVTLLARFWCGTFPAQVRRQAILAAKDIMQQHKLTSKENTESLLPYLLVSLADASALVRKATAELINTIYSIGADSTPAKSDSKSCEMYSVDAEMQKNLQVDAKDFEEFVQAILDNLEECIADAGHIENVMLSSFRPRRIEGGSGALRDRTREALLAFLVAHILLTPLISVQFKLLRMLRHVGKIKSKSKTGLLIPLLRQIGSTDEEQLEMSCKAEGLTVKTFVKEVISTISATNKEGLKLLTSFIAHSDNSTPTAVKIAAMEHLKTIWASMRPESQGHFASTLLEIIWQSSNSQSSTDIAELAAEVITSLPLNADVVCQLLDKLPALADDSLTSTVPSKRRKVENGHINNIVDCEALNVEALQRWSFVLELVEASEQKSDVNLVSKLCILLNDVHGYSISGSSRLQHVLSLLLDTCNGSIKAVTASKLSMNPNIVPVETIIDIFHTDANPQVQRSALLLIATLADIYPDVIIHHIMPVFTKMGQSILQHADEYSVHVAELAMQSIIPPLLSSFHKQKGGSQEGMVRLLLSFVAAFEHISGARRMALFVSLVGRLGPGEALPLLVLLFISKFGNDRDAEVFTLELVARYSASEQLEAVHKMLNFVENAQSEYPTPLTAQILQTENVKKRTADTLSAISVTTKLMRNPDLARKAAQELVVSSDEIRSSYSQVSERILQLSAAVHTQKRLSAACEALMDATLGLLPVHESIGGLEALLSSGEDAILRQTVKSIEQRVRVVGTGDVPAQTASLQLLPMLAQLLKSKTEPGLVQICIACADSIIERFGKKDVEASLALLTVVASPRYTVSADARGAEMAILCIATAAQVLGEAMVRLVPGVMGLTFTLMETAVASKSQGAVLNAAYTLCSAVLDSMPWVLTQVHLQTLLRVSAYVASSQYSSETAENRSSALELLARRIDTRDCIAALSATWDDAVGRTKPKIGNTNITISVSSAVQHLQVARTVVDASSKAITVRHSGALMALFLQVLDLPVFAAKEELPKTFSEKDVEETVQLTAEDMVAMVYKLNDATFRPLFNSLIEWANDDENPERPAWKVARHLSLSIFTAHFFGTLKSIVTSYSGSLVEDMVGLLNGGLESDSKNGNSIAQHQSYSLWCRVLDTLRSAFDNDADEYFQAPVRFEPLCHALVSQIARLAKLAKRVPDTFKARNVRDTLESRLIPTVVALANAADASENTKALNKSLLTEMRSQKPETRVTAIRCQQRLVEKIGEDWLANLPEMLPVIAEVLEDEDEEVVREARKWVRAAEEVLGESLDSMLQ